MTRKQACLIGSLAFFLGLLLSYGFFFKAPSDFPADTVITVESGQTLSGMAEMLEDNGYINSEFLFKAFLTLFGGPRGLVAGDYYMAEKQGVFTIAYRLGTASYDLPLLRVTIPEGTNVAEIAERFDGRFYKFDKAEFVELAQKEEGYLFPDTYYFLPNANAETVIKTLRSQFDKRIEEVEAEEKAFGRPLKDVIIMASILEEEGRTTETRRTIAGILWKRLSIKMPLQVDAAFVYVNGKKDSAKLTTEDLALDSPYNTYTRQGLPPGPITNPGLDSIRAAMMPIQTPYFYYLSDSEGNMHYAITHDEHVMNKEKYLR